MRTAGSPAARLRELLASGDELDRCEIAGVLGVDQRQAAAALAEIEREIEIDAGVVRLRDAEQAVEREPQRRGPSEAEIIRRTRARAAEAAELPEVVALRERLLGGELLEPADVQTWIEARSTRGERCDGAVGYGVPGCQWAIYADNSAELEPLRALSERLAGLYGWNDAESVVFVLTGRAPVAGLRVSVRRRFGAGAGVTYSVSGELADDPELAARALRRARDRAGVDGGQEQRRRRQELSERLVAFAAEHGTGDKARKAWNDLNPESRYSDRRPFYRAVQRARRAYPDAA